MLNNCFLFFSWKKRSKRTLSRTMIAKRQKHEKSKNRRKLTRSFSAVFTFVEGPPEWPQGICTLPFVLQPSAAPIIKVFVNLSQKVAGCWGRAPTSFLHYHKSLLYVPAQLFDKSEFESKKGQKSRPLILELLFPIPIFIERSELISVSTGIINYSSENTCVIGRGGMEKDHSAGMKP